MNNLLIVISGPSGSGKSTLIRHLLEGRANTTQISTYTTRKPREGEKNGEQYNFISPKKYLELLESEKLMACTKIENDYYGMPLLEDILEQSSNRDFLLDMGVSGGLDIKARYPDAVMIYLIPENEEQLLKQRGDRGKTRQARGIKQIKRVLESGQYEWIVKNKIMDNTVEDVQLILDFIRKKRYSNIGDDEVRLYSRVLKGKDISLAENVQFLKTFYKIREEEVERP